MPSPVLRPGRRAAVRPARLLLACLVAVAACGRAAGAAGPESPAAAATGLLLADAGRARMPVVISARASESTRLAAAELAHYLGKVSGATFEVTTGDGSGGGVVLGTLAEFPDPALAKPLEMRGAFDGREAFAIRTDAARVRLVGATDLGASHAAYALLEALGCRWFFQAPEWEVVPSTPTLRVSVNRDDRPALLARSIWYGGGMFEYGPKSPVTHDYAAWRRRNRIALSLRVYCSHAWQTIIAENRAAFDRHPEYLALVNGKRQGEQLCVSNPDLRALVCRWAVDYLAKHPRADMVSVEPSDGGGHCECDACAKLGTVSDRVFALANEVARAVAKERPGKLVGLYAYNDHSEPPAAALGPNVYVQLTAGFTRGRYAFDELLDLWPRKCRNMGFYDYLSVWPWDFDQWPGGRANDLPYLRRQVARYAAAGATSLDCESSGNFGVHGRGYYVAQKLMWDPKADVEALLADFYDKAFGPGAAAMRRYYDRFDRGGSPLVSEHLLALGFRDVDEAARLSAARPDVQARLDHVKQYLRFVHLRWQHDRAADPAAKKALILALVTHGYRTRYTYMNHWIAIRGDWANRAAEKYAEPTWKWKPDDAAAAATQPWAVDRPYAHAETEAEFQEGLAYFKPDPVEEKRFSASLLTVDFDAAAGAKPVESVQTYQWALPYALYSVAGEPLELSVTPGTIAHYRDMAPAKWTVTGADGQRIAGDRLPLDGKPHAIRVRVPAAGAYRFEFDDSSAGWQIRVAAGRRAAVVLDPTRRVEHAGWMQPMHFYVPRGTRELQYYWSGGTHRVHGPDGAVLKDVTTRGTFVRVPVPPGADGRTWHFSRLMLGSLWLFNAPNYLAASPAALLVPKDLAERDGLRVAK